jgi:AcrR family transcriptional regulator
VERRAQIVRAAATVFVTAGYEKTSMEDVARAAGVTRLIVYRIFESKEALYLAVLSTVLDETAVAFDPPPLLQPESGAQTIAGRLLTIARRHPDGFRLLWRHAANQPEFEVLVTQFKAAATDFASSVIAGVSPNPVVVRWCAQSLVSHVYESICLWLDEGDEALDPQFLQMLGDGLRAMVVAWRT